MLDDPSRPRSLVWSTAKAAVAIAVLCVAATQFLSGSRLDRSGMSLLVAQVSHPGDPVTTGSLGPKLDPCAVTPRR